MEKYLILVSALLLIAVHGQNETKTTASTTTTTTPTPPTTPSTKTTNKTATTTTTVTPTTPGKNKTTTSLAPTIAPTPNKNKTTTSLAPTIAPTPTPSSDNDTDPKTWTFSYMDPKTKNVCIVVQMAMEMVFSYVKKTSNVTTETVNYKWNLPNATVSDKSYCGNETQGLVLNFFESNKWELTMIFNKTAKGDKYEVMKTSLAYELSVDRFPNISVTENATMVNATSNDVMFSWADNTYLKCHSTVDYRGFHMEMANATLDHLVTRDMIMNAFLKTNNTSPPTNAAYTYCTADTSVSNIVPIAVGAALAGLVLIVLIAYLIGRSRNQRGYESV